MRALRLPAHRRLGAALTIVALITALASGAGVFVRGWPRGQVTGDEPHYLVTAVSLAEDGDLDLRDELAAERYRPFHELVLKPQGRPLSDGRLVSPHDPLLPLVLAAPVAAGGWIAAKLTLAALAGLLAAALLWTAVRRFSLPLRASIAATIVFCVSAPLAVYGTQVYPELPAALGIVLAVAALTGPFGSRGALVLGATVAALPWLATKYVPMAAALALLGLVQLARRRQRVRAAAFAGGLALAAGLFLAGHRIWYEGWTPYAGRDFAGGEFGVIGSDPDLADRARRLIGLLVDQEYGLAAWQPAWLLVLPALGLIFLRRPRGWEALVVPLGVGWLNAAFVAGTMHGWWWPGRHVVAVLPLAALVVAWWVGTSRYRLTALVLAGALGALTYAWTVVEGWLGELTWAVGFAETANPWYRAWRALLPDYRELTTTTWILHWSWVALAGGAIIAIWLAAKNAVHFPRVRLLPSFRSGLSVPDERPRAGLR